MKRSLSEWLSWQETLHLSEIDLGLVRIGKVAKTLGVLSPSFPIITIAGTNGKGSSVAILESILRAEGYKTGAYTSPHLIHYNERIAVNNTPLKDDKICSAFEKIDKARRDIEGHEISLTYFEFGTLAALLNFIEEKVDVALLEVGLGGRLDAANLWDASLAIISGIAIDHVSWLGNDREKIAIEKSGIMRKQHPVVCGDVNPPSTIRSEAIRIGATLYQIGKDFSYNKSNDRHNWEWQGWDHSQPLSLPKPSLSGDFQLNNAATVIAGLHSIKDQLPVSLSSLEKGLQNISLPGRMQILQKEPEWLVDVAHNPQSAQQLAEYLNHHPVKGKTYAIFSMLDDKDISQVLSFMGSLINEWHLVELKNNRGLKMNLLKNTLSKHFKKTSSHTYIYTHDNFQNTCHHLKKTTKNEDRVVAFGSFLVVSGVLENCGLNNN